MILQKTRIRNPHRHLGLFERGSILVFGISEIERFAHVLDAIGFSPDREVGESVLPSATFGPVSRRNAHGYNIVYKNRPMETKYRVILWCRTEWHGRDRIEVIEPRDVPYQRYQRTFIPPASVEMQIGEMADGSKVIFSPAVAYTEDNVDQIIDVINLYLEVFSECRVFSEDLNPVIRTPVRKLNWTILPKGRMPWEMLRRHIEPLVRRTRQGNQELVRARFEKLNSYGPDFVAVGRAGFAGYVIFGFPSADLYMCESAYTWNATYVFDRNWDVLSQMTKADILSDDLQHARIIHTSKWESNIDEFMRENGLSLRALNY